MVIRSEGDDSDPHIDQEHDEVPTAEASEAESSPAGAPPAPAYERASPGRRVFAKLIDMALVGLAVYGFGGMLGSPMAGIAIGFGWFALSDAWSPSPGKALLRLRALDQVTAGPCSAKQSLMRNAPILALSVPNRIHAAVLEMGQTEYNQAHPTIVWGLLAVSVIWYISARVSMGRDRWGRRPADLWAGTLVVRLAKKSPSR